MNTETNPQFHWESFVAELAQQQNDNTDNNSFELNWNELLNETKLLSLLFERDNNENNL